MWATIISNAKTETALPIIEEMLERDRIVYQDALRAYNPLVVSAFHHRRINLSKLFTDRRNHK